MFHRQSSPNTRYIRTACKCWSPKKWRTRYRRNVIHQHRASVVGWDQLSCTLSVHYILPILFISSSLTVKFLLCCLFSIPVIFLKKFPQYYSFFVLLLSKSNIVYIFDTLSWVIKIMNKAFNILRSKSFGQLMSLALFTTPILDSVINYVCLFVCDCNGFYSFGFWPIISCFCPLTNHNHLWWRKFRFNFILNNVFELIIIPQMYKVLPTWYENVCVCHWIAWAMPVFLY